MTSDSNAANRQNQASMNKDKNLGWIPNPRNESSDQDNLSSINDSKDSGRNSDDRANDSDVTEQCQEEDLGSVFTAVEAYDSSSAEDIGPYWNIGMHSLL